MGNNIIISRIQNRRGRRENLPQPLLPAEVALTADSGEAWIGSDPGLTTPIINVYEDKLEVTAQGLVDNNIAESKFDENFSASNFNTLVLDLTGTPTPAVVLTDKDILWDNTFHGEILDISTITTPGTGYTTGDAITAISATGSGFVGTITATAGAIDGIVVTSGGSNYRQSNTTFTIAAGTGGEINVVLSDIHGTSVHIAADPNIDALNTIANITTAVSNTSAPVSNRLISTAAFGGTFATNSLVVDNHSEAANVTTLMNRVNSTTPNEITGIVFTNLNIKLNQGSVGGGSPFDTPLVILADITTPTPPVFSNAPTAKLEWWDLDETDLLFDISYTGSSTMRFNNHIHGASIVFGVENNTGTLQTGINIQPDAATSLYFSGALQLSTLADGIHLNIEKKVRFEGAVNEWADLRANNANNSLELTHNNMTGGFEVNMNITLDALFMREQAAADADVTDQGQLWVRDDDPNVLMFTDDAGTDFQISSIGFVTIDTAQTITGLKTFDNTLEIIDGNSLEIQGTVATEFMTITVDSSLNAVKMITSNMTSGALRGWWFEQPVRLRSNTDLFFYTPDVTNSLRFTLGSSDFNIQASGAAIRDFSITGLTGRVRDGGLPLMQIIATTTVALETAANAINTSDDKIAGYMVFNVTTTIPLWAVGFNNTSDWIDATGTVIITPS